MVNTIKSTKVVNSYKTQQKKKLFKNSEYYETKPVHNCIKVLF